jgi:hypothetical protein
MTYRLSFEGPPSAFFSSADAESLQERIEGTLATEELLDRDIDVARVAHRVDFIAKPHAGPLIEEAFLALLEHRRHVGCDRIGPRVAVIAGVIAERCPM